MNKNIKIILIIMSIVSGNSLLAAAAPKISQEIAFRQLENGSEQALIKLAHSLGLSLTKEVSTDTESSAVEIRLTDAQAKQQAYIKGSINSPVVGMAYIDSLEVVNLGLRGKGIGQLLSKSFYDLCREKGCKKIAWHASSFGDHPIPDDTLVEFYKKIGGVIEEKQEYSTYMTIDLSGQMSAHK